MSARRTTGASADALSRRDRLATIALDRFLAGTQLRDHLHADATPRIGEFGSKFAVASSCKCSTMYARASCVRGAAPLVGPRRTFPTCLNASIRSGHLAGRRSRSRRRRTGQRHAYDTPMTIALIERHPAPGNPEARPEDVRRRRVSTSATTRPRGRRRKHPLLPGRQEPVGQTADRGRRCSTAMAASKYR